MRTVLVAALIVMLTATAFAQRGAGRHRERQPQTDEHKKRVDDPNFKAALDKLPDKKFDPWATIRPQPQPK